MHVASIPVIRREKKKVPDLKLPNQEKMRTALFAYHYSLFQ